MNDTADPQWVEPTQARSREKVERILDAAIELAVEAGSLDIKMTLLAKRAGVAIGTLYQFFPSRSALIGKLFDREMGPIDEGVAEALEGAKSLSDVESRIERRLSHDLELVRSQPGLFVIWSSPAVDPVVQAADFTNTRRNARRLADLLRDIMPDQVDQQDVYATSLLVCHLWSSVLRLCVLAEPTETDAIIRQYASMLAAHGYSIAV